MFGYVTLERRLPENHPLRGIRVLVDRALERMDGPLAALYSSTGQPSIAAERLLRAQLLQVLYSTSSEGRLMEQLDCNLLFRWFVGLEMDDAVWDVTVFTKNRERLIAGEVSQLRQRGVAPHISEYVQGNLGRNALSHAERGDERCQISQRKRKLIERVFGRSKLDRGLRQVKLRGLGRVDWFFRLAISACNLMRMRRLIPIPQAAS